jgi:hypothetical protein
MRNASRNVATVLLVLFILFPCPPTFAQQGKDNCPSDAPKLDPTPFFALAIEEQYQTLRNLRPRVAEFIQLQKVRVDETRAAFDKLVTDRNSLEAQATSSRSPTILNDYIRGQIEDLKKKVASNKASLESSAGNKEAIQRDNEQIQSSIQELELVLSTALADQTQITERLAKLQTLISEASKALNAETSCAGYAQQLNNRVEEKIVDLLIPDSQRNSFKLTLSVAYAIIVSLLIGGFFFVVAKDATVRAAIFTQQSGIQFITLFSLVIAIILFGILEILKDKELAALLGGLSGYILGRVGGDRSTGVPSSRVAKNITGKRIAFASPNNISDASGRLGVFSSGERIQVSGSANNNGVFTVASATRRTIQTQEDTVVAEPAGASITIASL